jgi:formylglycine-generating enzyme required for sulfatase activity
LLILISAVGPFVGPVRADTFGSGANTFEIDFVSIGNAGNPPDENPNPAGAVPYSYRIGKYEISEQMIDKANALGGLGITKDTRGPDKPATSISWYEAARFVNWLNTSTGSMPAYKFDGAGNFQLWTPTDPGYNPANLYRNRLARYFLPSLNEWHKAAYYDPAAQVYYDYPTGSDSIPDGIDFVGDPMFDAVFYGGASNPEPNDIINVGVLSPFATVGQGGNVFEWSETAFDRTNDVPIEQRRTLGGSWASTSSVLNATNTLIGIAPHFEGNFSGIRVAAVIPEPRTSLLLTAGMLISLVRRYARRLAEDFQLNYTVQSNCPDAGRGYSTLTELRRLEDA